VKSSALTSFVMSKKLTAHLVTTLWVQFTWSSPIQVCVCVPEYMGVLSVWMCVYGYVWMCV
jgi:hypothetical protein